MKMINTAISPKIGKAMIVATNRHNDSRQQRLTVFHKAVEMVKSARQWPKGENQTLFEGTLDGKAAQIYLKNELTGINLYLFVEGESLMTRFYSKPFNIGHFNLSTGFQVSVAATEELYLRWNLETRKALSK